VVNGKVRALRGVPHPARAPVIVWKRLVYWKASKNRAKNRWRNGAGCAMRTEFCMKKKGARLRPVQKFLRISRGKSVDRSFPVPGKPDVRRVNDFVADLAASCEDERPIEDTLT